VDNYHFFYTDETSNLDIIDKRESAKGIVGLWVFSGTTFSGLDLSRKDIKFYQIFVEVFYLLLTHQWFVSHWEGDQN
jgi:hypothetical protein